MYLKFTVLPLSPVRYGYSLQIYNLCHKKAGVICTLHIFILTESEVSNIPAAAAAFGAPLAVAELLDVAVPT
jgi:hypothetical protein